jgi:HlyD family secretion protein
VVNRNHVQIAAATQGTMREFVSTLASVVPAQALYLDAAEGGKIERVLAKSGDTVSEGQVLLELSNPQAQLDLLARKADLSGQLSALREKELEIKRSRLDYAQKTASARAQVESMEREYARNQRLTVEGAYAEARLEEDRERLVLQKELLRLASESQATDESLNELRLAQMKLASESLEQNLRQANANLDSLVVRAPTAGVLSSFDLARGQSIARGARIGQIDSGTDLKLVATVDEFYLSRLRQGLTAVVRIGDQSHALRVENVSAQVSRGVFTVELAFVGPPPEAMRIGQSMPLQINISEPSPALLIPNGPFMIATGGRWAFVLAENASVAERRPIVVGRRNLSEVEIIEGVEPGERVVVSAYDEFLDASSLQIRN